MPCGNVWASRALRVAFRWKEKKGKPNKEWITLKPGENCSGITWIKTCNNRQKSERGYPIDNKIMLLRSWENKNTILKFDQLLQGHASGWKNRELNALAPHESAKHRVLLNVVPLVFYLENRCGGEKVTWLPLILEMYLHVSLLESTC